MNPIVIVAPVPGATAQGSAVQGQPWTNLMVPCEAARCERWSAKGGERTGVAVRVVGEVEAGSASDELAEVNDVGGGSAGGSEEDRESSAQGNHLRGV